MEIAMIMAAVGQLVDQRRIDVERKDDRAIDGEQGIEVAVAQTVRMLGRRLQCQKIDDVYHANAQVREVFTQQRRSGQCLERGHVAATGNDDVREA